MAAADFGARPPRQTPLHPLAWIAWVAASVIALSLTRNPVYLLLVLAWIGVVLRAVRQIPDAPPLPLSPLRFALVLILFSALFNALTAHFGQTVLLYLPDWLPLLGGPVTLEALVYGLLNGLVLTGFFLAWTVLFVAVPTQALIRLIPRAFYPAGVVLSIAVAFVPTTFVQFQQIREAQAMRGHRVRGLRDGLPLVMPLLVGGLERALQLAEAMTARGFGSLASQGAGLRRGQRGLLVAGLAMLLAGLIARLAWPQQPALAGALLLAGGGLLLLGLALQGRTVQRTAYRRRPWTAADWLVSAAALAVVTVFLLPGSRASLAYSPYPALTLPALNVWVALATLGLLGPAVLLRRWQAQTMKNAQPSRRGQQSYGA